MIKECIANDASNIIDVINDAAIKYKGIIPDDCWHYPYMKKQELKDEIANGVRMFAYKKNNNFLGVMGIQEFNKVTLIRHAYTLTNYQGKGIGKSLLQYLFKINKNSSILVGTWKNATWAINFYQNFGFVLQTKVQTNLLLKQYWKIPFKQIENSVVLKHNK